MDQHRLLLALAGCAPDAWLAIAREALGDGETSRVADLMNVLDDAKTKPRRHTFTPAEPAPADDAVREATSEADHEAAAHACWVSLRDGTDRVYLVQAGKDADLPALTAAAQHALAPFMDTPMVEVFGPDHPLPPYHEQALLAATLLWTNTPEPPVAVARAFDGAGEDGPFFAADHELVVDPAERRRLSDFLAGGEVVLTATARLVDVLTGTEGVVPASLRSDGTWVWSEAVRYYLDRYQLAPDPDLAGHALTTRPQDRLDPLTRHHVRVALNPNDQEGSSWRAG